jgi:hypothetical protein
MLKLFNVSAASAVSMVGGDMLGDSKDVRHCSLHAPVALLLVTQEQLWREQYLSTST